MIWSTILMALVTASATQPAVPSPTKPTPPAECASIWDVEQCEERCRGGDVVGCEAAARLWSQASDDTLVRLKQQSLLQQGCQRHHDESCVALAALYRKADEPGRERAALVLGCTVVTDRSCLLFVNGVEKEGISDERTRIAKLYEDTCDTNHESCRAAALLQTAPARRAVFEEKHAFFRQKACRNGDRRSCLALFVTDIVKQPERPTMKREATIDLVATGLMLACDIDDKAFAAAMAEIRKSGPKEGQAPYRSCPLSFWEGDAGSLETVSNHLTGIDAIMTVACRKGRTSSCRYQQSRLDYAGNEADMKLCRGDVQATSIPACHRVLARTTTPPQTRQSASLSLCDAGDDDACRRGLLLGIELEDTSGRLLSMLCERKIAVACRLDDIDSTAPAEIEWARPTSGTRRVGGYMLKTLVDGGAVAKGVRIAQLWTWNPDEGRQSSTMLVQPTAKRAEYTILEVIRSLKVGERARVWPADSKKDGNVYEVVVVDVE